MTDLQIFFAIVLGPVAVYGLARLIFAAYFRTKADYLRRFFHATDQAENDKQTGG